MTFNRRDNLMNIRKCHEALRLRQIFRYPSYPYTLHLQYPAWCLFNVCANFYTCLSTVLLFLCCILTSEHIPNLSFAPGGQTHTQLFCHLSPGFGACMWAFFADAIGVFLFQRLSLEYLLGGMFTIMGNSRRIWGGGLLTRKSRSLAELVEKLALPSQ